MFLEGLISVIHSLCEGNIFSHVCVCLLNTGPPVTTTQLAAVFGQSQVTWVAPHTYSNLFK